MFADGDNIPKKPPSSLPNSTIISLAELSAFGLASKVGRLPEKIAWDRLFFGCPFGRE